MKYLVLYPTAPRQSFVVVLSTTRFTHTQTSRTATEGIMSESIICNPTILTRTFLHIPDIYAMTYSEYKYFIFKIPG